MLFSLSFGDLLVILLVYNNFSETSILYYTVRLLEAESLGI